MRRVFNRLRADSRLGFNFSAAPTACIANVARSVHSAAVAAVIAVVAVAARVHARTRARVTAFAQMVFKGLVFREVTKYGFPV